MAWYAAERGSSAAGWLLSARDLGDAGCTAAALECAAMGCGIVLTPAYATALVHWGHLDVPYVELLRGLVPNCRCHIDRHGNHRVFLM